MNLRSAVGATVVAFCVTTACSGGSGKSSASPPKQGTSTSRSAVTSPPVSLPPNIPRSEQFCAFPGALAAKLKGAKKPDGPEEVKPYIRDLATLFQQAAPSAPPQLQADVQKLNEFYTSLAQRLDSGASGPAVPAGLAQLTDSSNRLRAYFKTVCGVDDSVFNLFS